MIMVMGKMAVSVTVGMKTRRRMMVMVKTIMAIRYNRDGVTGTVALIRYSDSDAGVDGDEDEGETRR